MKKVLFFVFLIFSIMLQAQDRKSAARLILEAEMKKVTIRAIIVGVSEYANFPEEAQLLYADDDAKQLYEFLRSKPEIDSANIHIILNSEAHGTSIKTLLYNILLKDSDPGDVVIFYFAGHGDVDATIDDGFLLMHNVSADGDYFIGDALQVSIIQRMITQAGANGVKVLLITDACRSGKLVGDSQGALHTTAALIREWQHVLKLVSCQADQGSMESDRWGDGHGVFTFHLVNGLMGLADENKDLVVSFGEISDYVRTQVKKDTEYKQVPKSTGDETSSLFLVDTAALARAEKVMVSHRELFGQPAVNRDVNMRGLPADEVEKVIKQLRTGIENDNLRSPLYFVKDDGTAIQVDEIKTTTAHSKQIADLCYIAESDIVITAAADNTLRTWQGSTIQQINTLKKHKSPVLCVASNPANIEQVASGGMDNMICFWNVKSGKATAKIKEAHAGQVSDLVFTFDGEYLISAGNNKKINIWSTGSIKLSSTLIGHSASVSSLGLSPDGKLLVSGAQNGEVFVWNLQTKKLIKKLEGHKKPITVILFPKDNRSVITGSKGESIAIWDLDKSKLIKSIALNSSKDELLDGYNRHLLLRDKRGSISFLNTNSEELVSNSVKSKGVRKLHLSANNKKVFWVSGIGTLSSGDVLLPSLQPSVLDLYDKLLEMNVSDELREAIKVEVFSALVGSAERTIAPFIQGSPVLPAIEQVQESIINLEEALRIYPSDSLLTRNVEFQKTYLEVRLTLLSNDYNQYPKAIEKLDQIIKAEPNAAYTYNAKSIIYQKLNKNAEAKKNAIIAKNKTPNWTEPRNNLGKIYLEAGEYQKAKEEYQGIIRIKPESAKGYSHLGSIYHDLGDYKNAEKYYRESIAVDSLNPEIYLKYSELQLSRGRYKDAEKLLMKSNELDSTDVAGLLQSGRLYNYLFQKDFNSKFRIEQAHAYLVKANQRYPKEPRTYSDLSSFYISTLENGNSKGITYLYDVFEVAQHETLAELIVVVAKHVKLLCRAALKLNPYSGDALDGLAFATLYLTKGDAAENIYLDAIKVKPESPGVYCRYAKFSKNRGNPEKAVANYKKAIELDPLYLLAYIELWTLYREDDNMIGINELYKKANRYFPNSPIFVYKKSVLPGHKSTRKELELMFEKDEDYYHASVLAYNYNYKNLVGQPVQLEIQQYVTRIKKATRINDMYTMIQDTNLFGVPVYGVMHASGMITIGVEYDTIVKVNDESVIAIKNFFGKGLKDRGEIAGIFWFSLVGDLQKHMIKDATLANNGNPANKNDTYLSTTSGCYDLRGNIIVPEEYDRIYHFSNGNRLIQVEKNGKYGCYNLYGQYVIPIKYEMISPGFSVNRNPGVACKLGAKSVMLNYLGKTLK